MVVAVHMIGIAIGRLDVANMVVVVCMGGRKAGNGNVGMLG